MAVCYHFYALLLWMTLVSHRPKAALLYKNSHSKIRLQIKLSLPCHQAQSTNLMATAEFEAVGEQMCCDPLKGLPQPLLLGSASYTRKLILKEMGVKYHPLIRSIDEKKIGDRDIDTPKQLVHTVAHAKMNHLVAEILSGNCESDLPSTSDGKEWIVLTADQVVTCNDRILEKPENIQQAKEFVTNYGRYPCSTVGCVVLTHLPSQTTVSGIHSATIHFLPTLTSDKASELVDKLIDKEEPILSCAGGLMIENSLTQNYVDRIEGNMQSVMGLCPETVLRLLESLRVALTIPD